MFKIKSFIPALLLLAIIILSGCSKDGVTEAEAGTTIPILQKIYQDESNYTEYSYKDGLIVSRIAYSSGSINSSVKMSYNSDGLADTQTVVSYLDDYKIAYRYDSQKKAADAEVITNSNLGYSKTYTLSFSHNSSNLINQFFQYIAGVDTAIYKTILDYDDKGNLVSEKLYGYGSLVKAIAYSYDEKNNPLAEHKKEDIFSISFSPNNVVKKVTVDYSAGTTTTINYSYTYGQSGYPVSRVKSENGASSSVTETYIYKE